MKSIVTVSFEGSGRNCVVQLKIGKDSFFKTVPAKPAEVGINLGRRVARNVKAELSVLKR